MRTIQKIALTACAVGWLGCGVGYAQQNNNSETPQRKVEELKEGDPMPSFDFIDLEKNDFSLRKFRGKYIYIEIWATWCATCSSQKQPLKMLMTKYRKRNIVFIRLSVDNNFDFWRDVVKGDGTRSVELITRAGEKSDLIAALKMTAVPLSLLIDRQGKIISLRAPWPASPKIEKLLNEQEGL